jgi:cell division septation protein DedD
MPSIDAKIIQNLVEQIEALKKTLESAGDEGQIKLKNINLDDVLKEIPRTPGGKLDANTWGGLDEGGQRERHSKLSCVLEALKAAAGPGGAKQPCGYGAALIATSILLPGAATFFTLFIMLLKWPPNYSLAPVWGTLGAFAAWLVLSPLCCEVADAKHAIPSSYGELLPRLDELEAGLKGFCPATGFPINPCKNTAYYEAVKEKDEIRKDIGMKGLTWVLATGYSKVWGRLYRAEEAMIEVAPQKKVLEGAYYDEARLEGSDIKNHDDLLAKLRKAVVSIDPSAHKYLKSTAAVTAPPALAIGTTALPGGTVAVGYCPPLLATGGVPPYKWAVIGGAIPDGLVLSTPGVLRGTPTSDGHGNFTVQVTDSAGVAVEKYFDLLISPQTPATQPPLAISTITPLPWGTVDVEYAERLFANGGKPPYKWKVIEGTIPDSMDLSNEGVLRGRPVRDNTFKFTVEVADSTGANPIKREFTLLIKPSGAAAAVPVGGTEPERLARAVLRHVRNSVNEYRNARWNGLILARNRLLATFMLTGMIVFALLAIAIMSGAERSTIIAATVFYLVGGTAGLCNRLRSESQAEAAIPDYGLSAARLITIPLFSGLGAIGGLLFVAYLPFATPVFAPDSSKPPAAGTTEKAAPKAPAPAPAAGTTEKAAPKAPAPAPAAGTTEKAAPKAPKTPPKLEDIFDFKNNLIGLFVALVFGLAPGLLFDRLQQQADRYKADLKSSQSTGGAQKS